MPLKVDKCVFEQRDFMSESSQNESLSVTESVFESSSSEFLRCSGADHNTAGPEQNTLMHAPHHYTQSWAAIVHAFFFFFRQIKKCFFLLESVRRDSRWRNLVKLSQEKSLMKLIRHICSVFLCAVWLNLYCTTKSLFLKSVNNDIFKQAGTVISALAKL